LIWRIRERAAFRRLTADGRRTRSGALWCTYLIDHDGPDRSGLDHCERDRPASPPHVAFAFGRALGPAVVRNLVRRRLRMLLAEAPLPPGLYLFGGTPAIVERSFDALRQDVTNIARSISEQAMRTGGSPSSCA
jgi:ribonuclease P protein component